jgi:Protein of unknown function (DUF3616)
MGYGLFVVLGLLFGCQGGRSSAAPAAHSQTAVTTAGPERATQVEPEPGPAAASSPSQQSEVTFTGMCDASGAVALSATTILVADDEDNVLRVYDVTRGGAPVSAVEYSPALQLSKKGKKQRYPEADIEAATNIGARAYFLTSHGRNSSGKLKEERFQFFATDVQGEQLVPAGEPYSRLLDDLLADPRLSPYGLEQAAQLAPKAPGGLNIEGMTARFEGGVWIGFRNPLPAGRALLVPLLNPEGVIAKQTARFGEPLTLDLGGLGVRSLSAVRDAYLIAAGPFDTGAASQLFRWDGKAGLQRVETVDLTGYNPEAFFTPGDASRILLLSDDGTALVGDTECKRLKSSAEKRFRGLWVTLPEGAG